MKKLYAFAAALLMSASMFASRDVIPTLAQTGLDASSNAVFCIYFDGQVCNSLYAVGSFNSWSTTVGDETTMLKLRPVEDFDGWYAVQIPYSSHLAVKVCQTMADGSWTWDTQANNWVQAGTGNLTLTFSSDGNCLFGSAGYYTYYAGFQSSPCNASTVTVKIYPPACDYVDPTIAGGFNNWGNDADADTDMDMDEDEQGFFYYKTIQNAVGVYKLRGGYGWSNHIQHYNATNDEWENLFPDGDAGNLPLKDTTYYFNTSDYRYETCEEPVECDSMVYTITCTFPACEGTTPAIAGSFSNDGWATVVPMTLVSGNQYTATIKALCSDQFKYLDAVSLWNNELLHDATGASISNIKFGQEATITLDYSTGYVWKLCYTPTDVAETMDTKKAVKMLVNGKLVLVKGSKKYNVLGAEF